MKKYRYNPEQVVFGLRQAEEGTPVAAIRRKPGSLAPAVESQLGKSFWRSHSPTLIPIKALSSVFESGPP
jgi:hypothetical protein